MGLYQGSKSLIPKFELNMEEITADEVQSAWDSAFITLTTFTIDGTSYQADIGMTWNDWIGSSYNVNSYEVLDGDVVDNTQSSRIASVQPTDVITSGEYSLTTILWEFTINGATYQAEKGATWADWQKSSYNSYNSNVGYWQLMYNLICDGEVNEMCVANVTATDHIEKNGSYELVSAIITFDITGYDSGSAIKGMTWRQWAYSTYSNPDITIQAFGSSEMVFCDYDSDRQTGHYITGIEPDDVIEADKSYATAVFE